MITRSWSVSFKGVVLRRERGRQRQRDAHAQRGARTQRHDSDRQHEPGRRHAADYSVPGAVTFRRNDTEKSISFRATQDSINDDGESVRLALSSTLPDRVEADSHSSSATVSITDDDGPGVLITPTTADGARGREQDLHGQADEPTDGVVTVSISTSGSTDCHARRHRRHAYLHRGELGHQPDGQSVGRRGRRRPSRRHGDDLAQRHIHRRRLQGINARNVAVTVTDDEEVPVEVSFGAANYTGRRGR